MSQIFYTEVDLNLKKELNARSVAGYNRTTRDINYMVSKIANVELIAFKDPKGLEEILTLGGSDVRKEDYLPSGNKGFLSSDKLSEDVQTISWVDKLKDYQNNEFKEPFRFSQKTPTQNWYVRPNMQQRIPPYIVSSEIAIGDHSMGLLNTATIIINVPNMQRDLDVIEQVFMRPGRNVKLKYAHPESAIITEGSLTDKVLPSDKKLQALYPGDVVALKKKKQQIKKMNEIVFQGLIVNFDLSIQTDYTAQITLTLRGTSNVYTDVSMFINGSDGKSYKTEETEFETETYTPPSVTGNQGLQLNIQPQDNLSFNQPGIGVPANPYELQGQHNITEFGSEDPSYMANIETSPVYKDEIIIVYNLYDALYHYIDDIHKKNVQADLGLSKLSMDQILTMDEKELEKYEKELTKFRLSPIKTEIKTGAGEPPPLNIIEGKPVIKGDELDNIENIADQWYLFGDASGETETDEEIPDTIDRYITLGTIIDFINTQVLTKYKNIVSSPKIICDDGICFSNYFEQLCSSDPKNVLLLPADDKRGNTTDKSTTEKYGGKETGLIFFKDVFGTPNATSKPANSIWKGYQTVSKITRNKKETQEKLAHPSRIFLNLNVIKNIFYNKNNYGEYIGRKNTKFKLNEFLEEISNVINEATSGVVNMNLITHPNPKFDDVLLYYDANFGGTIIDKNQVKPYSVPMTARLINKQTNVKGNTPPLKDEGKTIGSIVQDFTFTAKMPSSVSTLSYVLNQNPDEISEDDIAPYLNLMYQHGSKEQLKQLTKKYNNTHKKYTDELLIQKKKFGENLEKNRVELQKALKNYVQFPLDRPEDSLKIMSPIFPFDASFTMDGINGLRYGDVLEFDVLPTNYRVNTVFSIIGVTHTVSQEGEWKTAVKCIMRPRIGL